MHTARIAVLGVNAWAVWLLVPFLLAGASARWVGGLLALPLLVLGAGLALRARSRHPPATWVLLGGYPATLAAHAATLPKLTAGSPYGAVELVLATASLLLYGAAAASWTSWPTTLYAAAAHTFESENASPSDAADGHRPRLQRALLAAAGVGALVIAVAAPLWGGDPLLQHAWGRASADEAAVLTTVVAGALGTSVVTLLVGPALRHTRRPAPSRRQVRVRVTLLLLLVLAGAFTWSVVQGYGPFE